MAKSSGGAGGIEWQMDTKKFTSVMRQAAAQGLIKAGEHMKTEIAEGKHGNHSNNVTGEYARSINYSTPSVSNLSIKVGSSLQRAIYYEYGTGDKAENGNGRKTPWVAKVNGKWVTLRGTKASRRMRGAFADERQQVQKILADSVGRYMEDKY